MSNPFDLSEYRERDFEDCKRDLERTRRMVDELKAAQIGAITDPKMAEFQRSMKLKIGKMWENLDEF